VIHAFAARRAGGGRTAPVFVCEDGVLAESADILAYADARMTPERRIYPEDEAALAEIRALERDFDERLGPQGRLWIYNQLHDRRDLAMAYGCEGVPGWERRVLRIGFPLAMWMIDRLLNVTPSTAVQAEADVRATFDEVDELLGDGRPYLCGDRFTAADLTFSALAAAVLAPPEYGVPLPQPPELPSATAATVNELRERPAGAHALRMFREERRFAQVSAGERAKNTVTAPSPAPSTRL
jgi:glutathione S-transferase